MSTIQQYNNITIEKVIGFLMLLFAVGFNLYLYRLEPTATIDPNDNTFQFALVERTNQIWDYAGKKCSSDFPSFFGHWDLRFVICHLSYLIDHWVPNWAQGYNLPFYYSHIPQILIVASWRLLNVTIQQFNNLTISLFQYYHWIIYLVLAFFPLSMFVSLRVIGLPWLTAGLGALLSTHLSTDGLYGLDPPSFLWRGYGLSSQLFAMIFLPLAIAYSYRYFAQSTKSQAPNDKQAPSTNVQNSKHFGSFGFRILNLFGIWDLRFGISGFWPAVFFLFATATGHLGIGVIAMLSLLPLAVAPVLFSLLQGPPRIAILLYCYIAKKQWGALQQYYNNITIQQLWQNLVKLVVLGGTVIFFLSYWIVPIVLSDNYHNISFWDPPWKFNSYGAKETIIRFLNGDLFDFGRFPTFTILVLLGIFASVLRHTNRTNSHESNESPSANNITIQQYNNLEEGAVVDGPTYLPFSLLFLFWLVMYFGRTTWGGLIDLIPGMKEFHLSRFIVGAHLAGLFLAPIGIHALAHVFLLTIQQYSNITIRWTKLLYCFIVILLGTGMAALLYPQTIRYNELNNKLILQANANYAKVKPDVDELFQALRSLPPGRVFAGRGGWWGRDFRVAETPYYMHLSTYGIPTVLWLPETWSPNSDTEQYFSEDQAKDYDLYHIRYVVAPPDQATQSFWKLIRETPTWKLYEVKKPCNNETMEQCNNESLSYFATGVRPAIVAVDKRSYANVVRLWIQADNTHSQGLFPELTFDRDYPKPTGLPNFKMLDEVTYQVPDGSRHNLFQEPPVYLPPTIQSLEQFNNLTIQQYNNLKVIGPEEIDSDMVFQVKVKVEKDCPECLVVLKQTYHPNWQVTIDGKLAKAINVFPFFIAVPLSEEGSHQVIFSYQPGGLKVALLILELVVLLILAGFTLMSRRPDSQNLTRAV